MGKHELKANQTPQVNDQPPSTAESTRSSTSSNENKLNSLSSPMMSTQSRFSFTFQLSAERWTFLTASSKVKPDSDSSSDENSAPVSPSLKSRTSTNKNSPSWLKPLKLTTTNEPTKSGNTGVAEFWALNRKPNSTSDSDS